MAEAGPTAQSMEAPALLLLATPVLGQIIFQPLNCRKKASLTPHLMPMLPPSYSCPPSFQLNFFALALQLPPPPPAKPMLLPFRREHGGKKTHEIP